MTPRFPSGVGHGAMRARLENPRASYATPGFRIGTTRAPRRRQLPTKRCHAALLCGATRAYQPDSSSKPLHRQPRAGVLGNSSTFARALRGHQHRPRDRGRRYNPLDSWSFHISRRRKRARAGRDGATRRGVCRRNQRSGDGEAVSRHSLRRDTPGASRRPGSRGRFPPPSRATRTTPAARHRRSRTARID